MKPTKVKLFETLNLSNFQENIASSMDDSFIPNFPSYGLNESNGITNFSFLNSFESPVSSSQNTELVPISTTFSFANSTNTQYLIQFDQYSDHNQCLSLLNNFGALNIESVGDPTLGLMVFNLPPNTTQNTILDQLSTNPLVKYIDINATLMADAISNDPWITNGSSWGMYGDQNINGNTNPFGSQATEAWNAGHLGSRATVVGIIDTGIDYTHPDLYLNVWINQKEIPLGLRNSLIDTDGDQVISFWDLNNNLNASYVTDKNANGYIDAGDLLADTRWVDNIDTDTNGYKDDLFGWDFVNNDNNPFDDNLHGTHVAGTIGAIGNNNSGVAGVNWNIEMMAIKFLDAAGSGSLANAVKALDYYTQISLNATGTNQNFVATNNSWGGGGSQSLYDAIVRLAKADGLFVAAAGNSAQNNDKLANYPSNYTTTASIGFDSIIAVAASTSTGNIANFSNFGKVSVDLAAPGDSIYSTLPNGAYGYLSGTSMATPFVTGALAMYASEHTMDTALALRTALLSSIIRSASFVNNTATGGYLDIASLMNTTTIGLNNFYYGTSSVDTITGGSGNDYIDAGAGIDRMNGAEGSDIYGISLASDHSAAEINDTGIPGGNDQIRFTAPTSTSTTNTLRLYAGDLGIESIAIGTGFDVNPITTATTALNIDASALLNGVSITGNSGNNLLTGTAFNDIFFGNPGNDTLNGGNGDDILRGGLGNDLLTGGNGADTFIFDTAPNANTNRDTIVDFISGTDKIQFSKAIFTKLGAIGNLSINEFYAAAGATKGIDTLDRIIYNTSSGALYYDADGSGNTAAVQVALIGTSTHPGLAFSDIQII